MQNPVTKIDGFMMPLGELAAVYVGYTYRGSLKNAASGNTAIIQMRDACQIAFSNPTTLARGDFATLPPHHLLLAGDLIFRSRGMTNNVMLIEKALGRTICICPLIFIRIKPGKPVLPAYLHWFINLPGTQSLLATWAHGKTIRMISATSMKRLLVPLPGLDKQQDIIAIAKRSQQALAQQVRMSTQTDAALLGYANGLALPDVILNRSTRKKS